MYVVVTENFSYGPFASNDMARRWTKRFLKTDAEPKILHLIAPSDVSLERLAADKGEL